MGYMLHWGPKNAETAKSIMAEKGDILTDEEKAYLRHVIDEGKRCEEALKRWYRSREPSG